MIRVLVVSRTARARRAVEAALREDRDVRLIGSHDSLEAPPSAPALAPAPDVVVLEAGPESHVSIPQLLVHSPSHRTAPLVILLDDLHGDSAAAAIRAGARAVLPRDAKPLQIRAAVHAAAAGLSALPATMATQPAASDNTALTPREGEILALLGEGLANKEVAARLHISEHTVKTHVAAIYEKLGASNRAEAVATGLRRGLILL